MKLWLKPLAVGVVALMTGLASAQSPVPLTVIVPTSPPEPLLLLPSPLNNPLPPTPEPPLIDNAGTGVRGFLHRHGLGCAGHHFWFGCGNLRSELTHIFGSCRTFYGEPCLPREGRNALADSGAGSTRGSRWGILGRLGCSSCLD